MAKTIRLRNVPDDLYARLLARAAQAGLSLSDFLLSEFRRIAPEPVESDRDRVRAL